MGEPSAFQNIHHPNPSFKRQRLTIENRLQDDQSECLFDDAWLVQNVSQGSYGSAALIDNSAPVLVEDIDFSGRYEVQDEDQDVLIPLNENSIPGSGSLASNVYNVPFGDRKRGLHSKEELETWLAEQFPGLSATVPIIADRLVNITASNPYLDNGIAQHARHKSGLWPKVTAPLTKDGAVNGLIKFRLLEHKHPDSNATPRNGLHRGWNPSVPKQRSRSAPPPKDFNMTGVDVPYLPPDFGRGFTLDKTDAKLLKFSDATFVLATEDLVAICSGRTSLPSSNPYIRDLAPMAAKNQCVRHALLSLAASYYMDYRPSQRLLDLANMHHKQAVQLLGDELNKGETYAIGKEDPVVGTLLLLNHDEIVNWDMDRAREETPKWFKGTKVAKMVLDCSDPGYRYGHPQNVQSSLARRSLGNFVAMFDVLSATVAPLNDLHEDKCPYNWLLAGNERDVRRIEGVTGLSSKLLHTFAQITHMTAKLRADPYSITVPAVAQVLEEKLNPFHQWSDHSEGHDSPEQLLQSCILDENGYVTTEKDITEVTAEAYVQAAQIYLQCRLLRRSRTYETTSRALQLLLQCISRCPIDGPLFTAQTPMFTVLIAGIACTSESEREIVRRYFIPTSAGARGNIPPVWRCLQHIWSWQIEHIDDALIFSSHDLALGDREDWWELMVAEINTTEGRLSVT